MIKGLRIKAFFFLMILLNWGCERKYENNIKDENLTFYIKNTIDLVRLTHPDCKIITLNFIHINEDENYIKIQSEPKGLNTEKLGFLCLIDGIEILIYPSDNKLMERFICSNKIKKDNLVETNEAFNDVYENIGYLIKIEKEKLIVTNVIGHLTPTDVLDLKNIYMEEIIKK